MRVWGAAILGMMAVANARAACNVEGSYRSIDGVIVKTPRCQDKAGATYVCGDGSFSFARHRRGACNGHDGVKETLPPPAAAPSSP